MQGLALVLLPFLCIGLNSTTDLLNEKFDGKWVSPTQPFRYFNMTAGDIQMVFDTQQLFPSKPEADQVELILLDPTYHNGKAARCRIPLLSYDSESNEWSSTMPLSFDLYNEGIKEQSRTCEVKYKIQMLYAKVKTVSGYQFSISLTSTEPNSCSLEITAQTSRHSNQPKVFYYCIFVSSLTSLSLGFLLRFLKRHEEDIRMLTKISVTAVCLCLVQMWYLMVIHLWLMVQQRNNYGYFLIPMMLIATQSAVCMKVLLLAFRAKHQHRLSNKKWMFLIISLFVCFNAYLLLMYLYPYNNLTVLLQGLYLMPQILKNSKNKLPVRTSRCYFMGLFVSQFGLGMYYKGCPCNLYSVAPSLSFVFLWMSIHCVEVVIVIVQRNIGGRFFIPQCVVRDNSSYSLMTETMVEEECGICIGSLVINEEFALTKCGHSYHEFCLNEWLKVNEKCPMCRAELEEQP